jgi:hypothetical protein
MKKMIKTIFLTVSTCAFILCTYFSAFAQGIGSDNIVIPLVIEGIPPTVPATPETVKEVENVPPPSIPEKPLSEKQIQQIKHVPSPARN